MTTPTKNYKLTFKPSNVIIDVDPAKVPYSETGLPGSILEIALGNGVDLEHVCGGNIACSTCHVIVKSGLESCTPITPEEQEQLDMASGYTVGSRLSCQCVPDGSKDIVVEIS
ncbi:MAG: 2Fe-2S iron-sulfur cluster-binding protein [Oligoflexia bacterium]|nr:2Fe-2S iron-sulfur cluster-binding protein [Oligoflexia bacterium]